MSAIITANSTDETRYYVRRIEFENVAPILLARNYSHGGKEFLPSEAYAKWGHGKAIEHIKVAGYVLKKDRTTGQHRTDVEYVTPASRYWGSDWTPKAPDWLLEMFEIETPTTEEGN